MREFTVTAALLGLTVLGLTLPAAAQAPGDAAAGCADKVGPSDGRLYAWDAPNCLGAPLPGIPLSGTWGPDANDRASSVMNRAHTGALGVAKLYENSDSGGGHVCLLPGEVYADDLSDDRFTNGFVVNDDISSHQWVNSGSCGAFLS